MKMFWPLTVMPTLTRGTCRSRSPLGLRVTSKSPPMSSTPATVKCRPVTLRFKPVGMAMFVPGWSGSSSCLAKPVELNVNVTFWAVTTRPGRPTSDTVPVA